MLSSSVALCMTSTVCCAVNIIFSVHFIEDFKQVNERKTCRDHETSILNRDFWIRASIARNSFIDGRNEVTSPIRTFSSCHTAIVPTVSNDVALEEEDNDGDKLELANAGTIDDNSFAAADNEDEEDQDDVNEYTALIIPDGDCHRRDLANDKQVNLLDVSHLDTQAFKNKITSLFKMRSTIQNNMTVSGTHDNAVWNFVESAMSGRGGRGMTKILLYYFCMRCEMIPDIDSHFQPFLLTSLLGDTVSIGEDGRLTFTVSGTMTDELSARKKTRSDNNSELFLLEIKHQGKKMLKHLSDTLVERKLTLQAIQKNHNFHLRLEVVKALGNTEELRKLMAEAKNSQLSEL